MVVGLLHRERSLKYHVLLFKSEEGNIDTLIVHRNLHHFGIEQRHMCSIQLLQILTCKYNNKKKSKTEGDN